MEFSRVYAYACKGLKGEFAMSPLKFSRLLSAERDPSKETEIQRKEDHHGH